MSVLSDMSNDDLEQIYYAASRQFPSSFDGLRAVAEAAVRAEREGAEPFGWWLHVKRHDAHYFAISEQERKGMEVLADQDDKIVPIYTAPPAAPVDLEDVAKDAERYRWMRSKWTTMHSVATDTTLKLTLGDEPWAGFGPDVIDSAIDAAMLAAAHNTETPT